MKKNNRQLKHLIDPPEAILLTLPVAFFNDRGMSYAEFEKYFDEVMADPDSLWNFKLTNLPTMDVAWAYLVFDGFVQYRLNLVQYERNVSKVFEDAPDGNPRVFDVCNWVILCGPPVKAPFDIPMRGFQGFRYSKQLF